MDRINGHPFYWPELRPFERSKILQQYADIVIELARHPFPTIGCLLPSSPTSWQAGPIVFDLHADRRPDGSLSLLGPFTSSSQYRRDIIQRHLDLIRTNQTHPKRRVDAYLLHLFLLEHVPQIAEYEDSTTDGFFLKHLDDKGDHLLVDDAMNVVGMIDWEWAQICPKAEAFSAPLCLASNADFYNGDNKLGEDELLFIDILESKGAHELAGYVRRGRLEHRLAQCIASDIDDKTAFNKAFIALRAVLLGPKEGAQDWQRWKRHVLKKYQGDPHLQQILKAAAAAEAEGPDVIMPDPAIVPYGFTLG